MNPSTIKPLRPHPACPAENALPILDPHSLLEDQGAGDASFETIQPWIAMGCRFLLPVNH